jgi:CheY-like chemotaxis protein
MAKLLLVEDDNNLREIYEARLQAEGYKIVSAKDGEEALVVAKAEKPDLVIADVMMPKISGFEMLDILRNTDELKGVKVIMLTALGQSDDQKRASKLGADRYLVKSQVTLEDIVRTAHELLGDQEGGSGGNASGGSPAPAAPAPAQNPAPAPAAPAPAAPAPAPAPKVKTETDASKDAAEPAAQEEANVESKIEDFVAGATSSAMPQAQPAQNPAPAAPAPAPAPAQAPAEPVQAKPTASDNSNAADDKLMADAVEELSASANGQAAKTTIPVNVAGEEDEEDEKDDTEEPPVKNEDKDKPGSKKVIKPLDTKPKKDINQLLAEEEAKETKGPDTTGQTVRPAPDAGKTDTATRIEDLVAGASSEPTTPETSDTPKPKPLKAVSGTPVSTQDNGLVAKDNPDKASGEPMTPPSGQPAPAPEPAKNNSGSDKPDPNSISL